MTRTFIVASTPAATASVDPTRPSAIRRKLQTVLLAAFVILSVTACLADPEVDEGGEIDGAGSVDDVGNVGNVGDVDGADPVAQAASWLCSVLPGDGSYVCLTPDRQWLVVCDQHADGHRAYTRTYRHGVVQDPLYDQNGAGCSAYPAHVGSLDSFNICVQYEGCGLPVYP